MDPTRRILGVDNGISGAIALAVGTSILIRPTPCLDDRFDIPALAALVKSLGPDIVVLEKTQKQPRFGCRNNFTNGYCAGQWDAVLAILGMPAAYVDPKVWQKSILKGFRGIREDTKTASVEMARFLWPEEEFKRTARSKTWDHNMADAALIARYAQLEGF